MVHAILKLLHHMTEVGSVILAFLRLLSTQLAQAVVDRVREKVGEFLIPDQAALANRLLSVAAIVEPSRSARFRERRRFEEKLLRARGTEPRRVAARYWVRPNDAVREAQEELAADRECVERAFGHGVGVAARVLWTAVGERFHTTAVLSLAHISAGLQTLGLFTLRVTLKMPFGAILGLMVLTGIDQSLGFWRDAALGVVGIFYVVSCLGTSGPSAGPAVAPNYARFAGPAVVAALVSGAGPSIQLVRLPTSLHAPQFFDAWVAIAFVLWIAKWLVWHLPTERFELPVRRTLTVASEGLQLVTALVLFGAVAAMADAVISCALPHAGTSGWLLAGSIAVAVACLGLPGSLAVLDLNLLTRPDRLFASTKLMVGDVLRAADGSGHRIVAVTLKCVGVSTPDSGQVWWPRDETVARITAGELVASV